MVLAGIQDDGVPGGQCGIKVASLVRLVWCRRRWSRRARRASL